MNPGGRKPSDHTRPSDSPSGPSASSSSSAPARPSIATRLLRLLADLVYRYPRVFFYPQVILFFVSILFTVEKLQFSTSRNDLVGADKEYHRHFLALKSNFPAQDDLVAIIESEDIEKNRQFVERLGKRLEVETNLFTDVFYKGDLKMMGRKALLFVPEISMLQEMLDRLRAARPMIENFTQATNLNSLVRLINRGFRTANTDDKESNQPLLQAIPAIARVMDQAADALIRPGTPPSPGVTALFDDSAEAEQSLYITFATNRIYLVTARARTEELNEDAVHKLRSLVRQTQAEVPGVNVGITGEPVLEVDEMAQSQKDSTVATVVSLVICAILFGLGYQETGRPIKATICLIVGLGYTMGFTTLVVGHLNILTITFLPILIGLAIDFGIHLVTRYEEEMRRGRTEREAIEKAMVNTGLGIFTGCFTTSGAFLAMGLTDFKGIQEMGIISGGGLLICLVPMMTLLPVLLLRGRQNVLDHQPPAKVDARARIERIWLERPGSVAGITLALCIAGACYGSRVGFDYNLLNLQSKGLPAVTFERKLIDSASKSVLYGAVVADSLAEAKDLEAKILKLPSVSGVDSMVHYLGAEDQEPKLALIKQIKAQLADVRLPEPDLEPVDLKDLKTTLSAMQAYFGLGAKFSAREGEKELSKELLGVRQAIKRLRETLLGMDPEEASRKLAAFQQALFSDLTSTLAAIRDQDDRAPLSVQDLPVPLRNRFVSQNGGKFLLQVNPKLDVWQRENQKIFIEELRRVYPQLTGTPVQLYEYTKLLKESFQEAALYALAAIAILVYIHFRNLTCVVLSLLPVGIGVLWSVGWMGWSGTSFNPANIMTLPLVVGIGVTNGIHILNRFTEEQNPSILARSTGKAVLLSALTTIAGFGSLVPAKHQGIASLGMVMAVGTAMCMIAALTFLPALLNWLVLKGWLTKLTGLKASVSAGGSEE